MPGLGQVKKVYEICKWTIVNFRAWAWNGHGEGGTDLVIAKILDQWLEGICHMLRGIRIDNEQPDLRF